VRPRLLWPRPLHEHPQPGAGYAQEAARGGFAHLRLCRRIFGSGCETVCSNDCFNGCLGHGACVHGWCNCQRGWYGVDCSNSMGLRYRRASLPDDRAQFGEGPRDAQLALLPPALRVHAARLRQAVFVYNLPPEVNRASEAWMWRNWGDDAGQGCDPVHNRRIYSAQSHFDAHLLHDDFARTVDPDKASLFYVPLFLSQLVSSSECPATTQGTRTRSERALALTPTGAMGRRPQRHDAGSVAVHSTGAPLMERLAGEDAHRAPLRIRVAHIEAQPPRRRRVATTFGFNPRLGLGG